MKHLLILAVIIGTLFFIARGTVIPGPYTYDEPDYMYAASLGWWANATDSPSMPLVDFIKTGMNRGRNAAAKTELSETIRDSGDVVFYRHWHGPVYAAWLNLMQQVTTDEHFTRTWNYVFPIAAVILMYFGSLWLMPGPAGQTAAVLSSIFYLWSYPVVRSTELGPHQLFAACIVATLLLLAAAAKAPERFCRNYWYAAIAVTAIAFCLLEVALALILTVLIYGHLMRARLKPSLGFAVKSVGVFLLTVLIVWPGALLKLSLIKAYLFMAYLAVFRHDAWGPGATLSGTWGLRFIESPVPWVAAVFAAVYFLKARREGAVLIPFAVFSVLMAGAIFPVKTAMARYTLPLWPGLVLFGAFACGLALAGRKPAFRYPAILAICIAMLASSWPSLRSTLPTRNTRDEAMLALIRDRGLAAKTVMVPHEDVPMLHYYFRGSHFRQYYEESVIPAALHSGTIDGAIDRSDPPRWIPAGPER